MKIFFTCLVALMLVACGHNQPIPDPIVITKYQYVIVSPTSEMVSVPTQIPVPDPETATDKDVAKWIVAIHGRMLILETKLSAIQGYMDKRVILLENSGIHKDQIIR